METKPNFWPKENIGLSPEKYDNLTLDGKVLYNMIFDYCTYSSDPQYQTLHKFRKRINNLKGTDRETLIEYFNNDPAIRWNGMSSEPFEYYSKPY